MAARAGPLAAISIEARALGGSPRGRAPRPLPCRAPSCASAMRPSRTRTWTWIPARLCPERIGRSHRVRLPMRPVPEHGSRPRQAGLEPRSFRGRARTGRTAPWRARRSAAGPARLAGAARRASSNRARHTCDGRPGPRRGAVRGGSACQPYRSMSVRRLLRDRRVCPSGGRPSRDGEMPETAHLDVRPSEPPRELDAPPAGAARRRPPPPPHSSTTPRVMSVTARTSFAAATSPTFRASGGLEERARIAEDAGIVAAPSGEGQARGRDQPVERSPAILRDLRRVALGDLRCTPPRSPGRAG